MAYQNRVTPFGAIEASGARGTFMGNRGILHDANGVLGPARWRHKNWVICLLAFKDRKAKINRPGHYTQLFFCDEATALAAGHRPCAECRRSDYRRFTHAWQKACGLASAPTAKEIDDKLHRARLTEDKRQKRQAGVLGDLPDGTFVSFADEPEDAWLLWRGHLYRWTHEGYRERRPLVPGGMASVLTPEPTVQALRSGYVPTIHATAFG